MQVGDLAIVYDLNSFLDSVLHKKAPPQPQVEVRLNPRAYIRQVAFHQSHCLITESPIVAGNDNDPQAFMLHLADLRQGKQLATLPDVTSAIFNQAGTHVIASTYACDQNILMLNRETLAKEGQIQIDLSENCDTDLFKIYQLTDYY